MVIGLVQAAFIAAIGADSTYTAAIISGVFLIANTWITLYLTNRYDRRRPRFRRRPRTEKKNRPARGETPQNSALDPERRRDRSARDSGDRPE